MHFLIQSTSLGDTNMSTAVMIHQTGAPSGGGRLVGVLLLAHVVGAARQLSHYTFLLAVGCWILLLFTLLYRSRLVPRPLAAFGMIGAVLQIAGVSLRGLLGYSPEVRLAMPLAPAYVLLAVWLLVKGLDVRHRPLEGEEHGAASA